MKKLLIAALLVIGLSTFAQERKERPNRDNSKASREKLTPEQRSEKHLKNLTTDLNLNEKQQEQVGKIIAEQGAKREAFKTNKKAEHEAMKGKMQEEKAAMDAKMKAILTPEQMEKWKANNEKRRAKIKERMHEKRGN
jgi:protein CpxP